MKPETAKALLKIAFRVCPDAWRTTPLSADGTPVLHPPGVVLSRENPAQVEPEAGE
jgi:hypothetical protein